MPKNSIRLHLAVLLPKVCQGLGELLGEKG